MGLYRQSWAYLPYAMRDVIYPQSLSVGNLVNLDVDLENRRDLEFSTCGSDHKSVTIWERVDIKTFPSCNDYHGRRLKVPRGTIGIVVGVVGVPEWVILYLLMRKEPAPSSHRLIRNDLTVYDILVHGHSFQVFGCDMKIKRS